MSLTLTTFASGATIDADTMRSIIGSIELYLNEQTIAADRATGWVTPTQVYRPDFFGAPNPHTTLTSGETYFRYVNRDIATRRFSSRYLNTDAWIPVPGLCATIQVPESMRQGAYYYLIEVFASFYVREWGGLAGALDNFNNRTGVASLSINGTAGYAQRYVFKGSTGGALNNTEYYTGRQVTMAYAVTVPTTESVVNVGVTWQNASSGYAITPKHIIFEQGNLMVRYYLR